MLSERVPYIAPKLLDLQLKSGNQGLLVGALGPDLGDLCFGKRGTQSGDVVRRGIHEAGFYRRTRQNPRFSSALGPADSLCRGLPGGARSPGLLRVAPVDRVEQIRELGGGDRHRAVSWTGPNETAPLKPLHVERHAEPVMPEALDQIAASAAEDVQFAGVRIAAEPLLHLQRQRVHPAAQVGHPAGQPRYKVTKRYGRGRPARVAIMPGNWKSDGPIGKSAG